MSISRLSITQYLVTDPFQNLLLSETQMFSTLLSSTELLYCSSFGAPPSHLSRTSAFISSLYESL